jgi:hypothetical protein
MLSGKEADKLPRGYTQAACFQLASGLELLPQYASQVVPN